MNRNTVSDLMCYLEKAGIINQAPGRDGRCQTFRQSGQGVSEYYEFVLCAF